MPVDNSGGPVTTSQGAAAVGSLPGNTAMNSSEQIYSPVLIRKNAGQGGGGTNLVPGFEGPGADPQSLGSFAGLSLNPTVAELSPYFSNVTGSSTEWIQQCDFQIAYNDSASTSTGGPDVNLRKVNRAGVSSVLVNHFRGPLILSGWGFDHGDRSVPNNGSDVFSHDAQVVNNRSTWKAGPVDLKWDEVWKVWGSGHHMVSGIVDGNISAPSSPCSPTTFTLKVFRNSSPSAVPTNINCDEGHRLLVYNRDPSLEQDAVNGMVFCIAARINYEYLPVWVGCPEPEDAGSAPCCG